MRLLSEGLEETLRRHNHWWRGERIFGLPPVRRWAFQRLFADISGKGLAPVTVLHGPRQVGKTTLLNQVIDELIKDGIAPKRIFRIAVR
jgi:predicted AAA+ superfamily ATPase